MMRARFATLLLATLTMVSRAGAQTPQEQELLRRNPDLVRMQLVRSGLTADQIRQRLQQAGYSTSALDQFLTPAGQEAALQVTPEQLRALEALGLPPIPAEGQEAIPVDTGAMPGRARLAETAGLPLFGLNIFRGRTTLFQPVLSGPVPPDYRLGPGDELVLVITGDVEFVHILSVTREGFVIIPQVGQVFVANLTMEQLRQVLRQRLSRSYSRIQTGTTKFDATITRLRTNQVYVLGEVLQPGAYQLASVATALNALYAAGGLTEEGNFRQVTVVRGADTVAILDLYQYLLQGSRTHDVVLAQGDLVFVPVRGVRASITGAVTRPAVYELRPGETLDDLVRMAGGFRPTAQLKRVAVHRILPAAERAPGPTARAVVDVPLQSPAPDGAVRPPVVVPALRLEDGDSAVVDFISPLGRSLHVTIAGMVNKPGIYPWSPGMTLHQLVTLARGPRVGADLREAEVARLPQDRSGGQLAETMSVPLDSSYLFERDAAGTYVGAAGVPFPPPGTAPEVQLEPYDQVTIFPQPQFEFQRAVHVSGEVVRPGTYALRRKDERLSDLVERAGGLLATGYGEGARFYRLQERPPSAALPRSPDAFGLMPEGPSPAPQKIVRTTGEVSERVNIELTQALRQPGRPEDVVLQPGDSVHVPEYSPIVRVEGAVNSPTNVLYRSGAGLGYYVDNAGGYARDADKGRVSVQQANGSAQVVGKFLVFRSAPRPGPGSIIRVPSRPPGAPVNLVQILGTTAQLLGSAVAIVAILAAR